MAVVIDVPALAEAQGRTGVEGRISEPTAAQETSLRRVVGAPILHWRAALAENVLPSYEAEASVRDLGVDDPQAADRLSATVANAAEDQGVRLANAEAALTSIFAAFGVWHAEKFLGSVSRAARIDIRGFVEQFQDRAALRSAVRRNVALIRGLDDDLRKTIERSVLDAWDRKRSAAELRHEIQKSAAFAPKRARLIARDQLYKLAGELDARSAEKAGLTKFVWQHSLLPNPREHHLSWHGRTFSWSNPPDGVIPGEEINCRCRAAPYIGR